MKNTVAMLLMLFTGWVNAADNVENKSDYVIEAGDVVRISVLDNPELTKEEKVSSIGTINYPFLGEVMLQGLRVVSAEKRMGELLVKGGFLREAKVSIVVLTFSKKQVLVLGKVAKPGKYAIEPGTETLFDFIAVSGGISSNGSDVITIVRTQKTPPERLSINLDQLLTDSAVDAVIDQNLSMQTGDLIYVSEKPVIYLYGEVNGSGVYPYRSKMIVAQALTAGGGISSKGTENGMTIQRRDTSGTMQEIEVDLFTEVQPNDIIFVEESIF